MQFFFVGVIWDAVCTVTIFGLLFNLFLIPCLSHLIYPLKHSPFPDHVPYQKNCHIDSIGTFLHTPRLHCISCSFRTMLPQAVGEVCLDLYHPSVLHTMYSTIKHILTASPITLPIQLLVVFNLRVIASHLSHTLSRRGKREVLRHHLKPMSSHDTAFSEPSSHCTFANRPFSGLARIPTTHIGNTPTSLPTNSKASPPANQKIPSEWNMQNPTENPRNGTNRTAFLTCIFRMRIIY